MNVSPNILFLTSFLGAFIVSLVATPAIISLAGRKQLFDMPDNHRKFHSHTVSSLGGVAIFFAYIIVTSLVVQPFIFGKWHYLIAASLLFFLTGLMDDLVELSSWKKLIAQLVPIAIVVIPGDIRLHSLYGLLGVNELSYGASVFVTIFSITFFTNAFNFIDGIDGLAGTMGILYTLILGICLSLTGNTGAACLAFSLMGATAGFLRYNITPARIFMGDTGSLLLGFTISVLSILFLNSYNWLPDISHRLYNERNAAIFILALLSLPIAVCLRVFTIRLGKGLSPFRADRNHLHYFLLDTGLSHIQAVMIILLSSLVITVSAYLLQPAGPSIMLLAATIVLMCIFTLVYLIRKKKLTQAATGKP
ncbi:MAG: UDP-N-acetylmuramyl pentapeptide phosphotransferase/UDP-N-acetylglucosamine-phosphate transferase [Flavipsychrobacter sp.]|jgi:UDP-N-acetylmuramyl pentapeptide phosphotransferase/UDP-N-acetylglucosamine-1-phosphate transferase|nr:UDP-N-acetylmuramyl pentapeptide phosphotransferase/UDP-N-acetylglucosamine-phosphate transferase [Flavipsychrobacter sp.]